MICTCNTGPPNMTYGAIGYVEEKQHPIDRSVELLKQLSENGRKSKKKTGHPFAKYIKQKRTH